PVSATSAERIMVSSSNRLDADSFDYVAQITRSVPKRLYRLHLAAVAGRAHLEIVFTDCQPDRHLPFAEGIFPQISAEFGLCPGISSISGDCNSLDARAAVVMKDLTLKRLIGTLAFGAVPGSTQLQSLSGIRYAVFIQNPSKTPSITVISLRC